MSEKICIKILWDILGNISKMILGNMPERMIERISKIKSNKIKYQI